MTRIFQAVPLKEGSTIALDSNASHHVARVLRAAVNDTLVIFNGMGGEYTGTITEITKKSVHVLVSDFNPREAESPLELWLAQGISRGEKMDYTIQKAVELGVKKIIPLFTERCTVKLDQARLANRLEHWQAIIISACEQSGRNRIPELLPPMVFKDALPAIKADWCFALSPHVKEKLNTSAIHPGESVLLIIGPEGGLSDAEMELAKQHQCQALNLGPRVMRTETAAVAAITVLQSCFGDLN